MSTYLSVLPKNITRTLIITQEEAYQAVKQYIFDAFVDILKEYMEGNEKKECFENVHDLKNNFDEIVSFFNDLCANEIFNSETFQEVEAIVITSEEKDFCIQRKDFEN